ncbi:MAG TPA: GNAT family N-acetyltransferase [Candidatus Dormibacteraeota bacterium]|nr:GNAT family N-acetyltransferase [Candidatus Dormibacteraeota bacterium]
MLSSLARVAPNTEVASSGLRVTVVEDARGFDRLRDDWNAIAERMEPSSPMLSWEWMSTWWRYFNGGSQLRIVTFERDGRVIGIAPFQERRLGVGPMALAVLKPIGWEDYGNQGMTEHIELLFPPDHRNELMDALARWLRSSRLATAWLPSIASDQELPAWLAGHVVRTQPWVPFHHRALPSDWLGFVQGLNKSMRSNSRYYAKLLIRHGHTLELEVAQTPADVSRLLPVAIGLHRTRAGATHVSRVLHHDHFYRPDRIAFLSEMAPRLAEDGEFKVGLLHVDGDVVAGQMWFERDCRIFLYYSGFVPEWSKYGVQLVTTLEVLKHGMRRGVRHVEFLRGGGQLKERWDSEARLLRNTMIAPNRLVADGMHLADRARLRWKRLVTA